MKRLLSAILLPVSLLAAGQAATRMQNRYVLVLQDQAVAARLSSRKALNTAAGKDAFARVQAAQTAVKRELANRNIHVIGSVQALMNAVFVSAPDGRLAELRALPGVKQVLPSRPIKLATSRSLPEAEAQRAISNLAAQGAAADGAGVKIGIIDTGIDQNHPGFHDPSLTPPTGFPKGDTAYTNSKVIVARSYVPLVGAGFTTDASGNPQDPAVDSRPDDLSARDRVGHGTAVAMIAAGVQNTAPNGTVIAGVAPKAFLGNYKIYGSPGVNDYTFEDVMYTALDDAYRDGMDIVTVFIGALSAFYGPLDKGVNVCNDATACDLWAMDADTYGQNMVVVVSAGDDGDLGVKAPTQNTINSPGTAPSAITVGALTTAQDWASTVTVTGGAPSNLTAIPARIGNGPAPAGQLTGALRDVAGTEAARTGQGCSASPGGSLAGAIALIQRGGQCGFGTKVANAAAAGATAVIFYQVPDRDYLIEPTGLTGTSIPAVMVSYTNGKALKDFIAANPNRTVAIDPALRSIPAQADTVAPFSSRGPSIADSTTTPENQVKPEIAAPGVGIYTATQKYDPNSDMYSASGYTSVQGTTFSTGFVAGAAALVKQSHPAFLPAQIKSAVVNTASGNVVLDAGIPARVTAVGAGKLNPAVAAQTTLTLEPATISFGELSSSALPIKRNLTITNTGATTVHVTLDVAQRAGTPDSLGKVTVLTPAVDLAPGANTTVTVQMGGSLPSSGLYEGVINVGGGAVPLRVPYLYSVPSDVPYNAFPIAGFDFVGLPNALVPGSFLAFKLIDQSGVPVYGYASAGTPATGLDVSFRPTLGGGHMWNVAGDPRVDPATDLYGIAAGWAYTGPSAGEQEFTASVAGLNVTFGGLAINPPAVNAGGVVNAASYQVGSGLAPGSYVSIYGTYLAHALRVFQTSYLPVSLGGVSVSFDVAGVNPGWPGRIHYVSPTQINVQIPWELGNPAQTSAKMKVSVGNYSSSISGLYSVPLAPTSPGVFEIPEPTGGTVGAILDTSYRIVNSGNPAKRGQYVQIYANGLGPVTNQPASGDPANPHPASLADFSTTTLPVTVSFCGKPAAAPYFAGLAPGFVGLYQVNALVPADCATGMQQVVINANGVASKSVRMPIQ